MSGLLLVLAVFALLVFIFGIWPVWREVKGASEFMADPLRPPEFDGTEPVVTRRDRLPR